MTTTARQFVIETDEEPWLFVAVVCTISVAMILGAREGRPLPSVGGTVRMVPRDDMASLYSNAAMSSPEWLTIREMCPSWG